MSRQSVWQCCCNELHYIICKQKWTGSESLIFFLQSSFMCILFGLVPLTVAQGILHWVCLWHCRDVGHWHCCRNVLCSGPVIWAAVWKSGFGEKLLDIGWVISNIVSRQCLQVSRLCLQFPQWIQHCQEYKHTFCEAVYQNLTFCFHISLCWEMALVWYSYVS